MPSIVLHFGALLQVSESSSIISLLHHIILTNRANSTDADCLPDPSLIRLSDSTGNSAIMSLDNYNQFPNAGQPEGAPGQPPAQNGSAPGQQGEQPGAAQMQFPGQDVQGMNQPPPGQEGKTTLW